jgi:hypothetical protein
LESTIDPGEVIQDIYVDELMQVDEAITINGFMIDIGIWTQKRY